MHETQHPWRGTLVVFLVAGILLLVALCALVFFQGEMSTQSVTYTNPRAETLSAQLVAILVWVTLALTGGFIWIRALVRPPTTAGFIALSSTLALVALSAGVFFSTLFRLTTSFDATAVALFALVITSLVGLLVLLARQILSAMFS